MAPRAKKEKLETINQEVNKEIEYRLSNLRKNIKKEPEEKLGEVAQVMGAVVDVKFKSIKVMPAILTALECEVNNRRLVLEVEQHLGDNVVRTIAMDTTDGLSRSVKVYNTNKPITIPVGKELPFLHWLRHFLQPHLTHLLQMNIPT